MKVNKSTASISLLLLIPLLTLGAVRTLRVDGHQMSPIHLKMGQSTVLRFREKPKKAVVGNQNYYNIEFIENDLAIQPLGIASSNLFVYGENHTYGFILQTNQSGNYDDLVQVHWSSTGLPVPINVGKVKKELKFNLRKLVLGKNIEVSILDVFYHSALKTYILDFEVNNKATTKLKMKSVEMALETINSSRINQSLVYEKDELAANESGKGRIFFKLKEIKNLVVQASLEKWKTQTIIEEKYLSLKN